MKIRFLFFFILFLWMGPGLTRSATPQFRFGVLTDIQYADQEPADERHYRASLKKLEEAVEDFNRQDLAFVIHLGDFIDADFQSFDILTPIWNGIKTQKYQTLGNHDYAVAEALKKSVPKKLGMAQNYYEFTQHPWRFIVLDGNELSFHAHVQGTAVHEQSKRPFEILKKTGAPNAHVFNGAISEAQLDWLNRVLMETCRNGQRAVVFSHYPVYPKYSTNLWNDEKLISILESHSCVFAYMNGHQHSGGYGVKKGIHYVTLHGVVETAKTNAYAIVEVYQDHLEILGRGREPNRTLKLETNPFAEPVKKHSVASTASKKNEAPTDFKVQPLQQSHAYQMYQKRSKSELSKLIYLIDRFADMQVTILYDGVDYDAPFARKVARRYLQRKYHKENAKKWIAKHAYRSQHAGDIIQVRFPNGKEENLKEVFIQELEALEQVAP